MQVSADVERAYTIPPEQRGWNELSIAIVRTAVDDYRHCRKAVLKDEGNKSAQVSVKGLRTFFLSDVFENISGVESPVEFLQKLDDQIEMEHANNTKRKRTKKVMLF